MNSKKIFRSAGLLACIAAMGIVKLPSSGNASGGTFDGCGGGAPSAAGGGAEIGSLASAMTEPDLETVSTMQGDSYDNWTYYQHAKAFDWNSCVNPFYGQCVEQWGSFPAACNGKQTLALSLLTDIAECATGVGAVSCGLGFMTDLTGTFNPTDPWTYANALYADGQAAEYHRFYPGKRCKQIKNTRVSKDGGSSCYGGKWNSYADGYSWLNIASTYTCDIKKPSATDVSLTLNAYTLNVEGSHVFSHPTGATTERSVAAKIELADDTDGTNDTVIASATQDSDLSAPYSSSYTGKYMRYCVKTSFLAEKFYQYWNDVAVSLASQEAQSDLPSYLDTMDKTKFSKTETVWADDYTCSDWKAFEAPPQATDVAVSSYKKTLNFLTGTYTNTVTGSYTFSDLEGRAESGTTFTWYIDRPYTDPVAFGTTQTATIPSDYLTHDSVKVKFCVTPHDTDVVGATKCSGWKWLGKPSVSSVSYTFAVSNGQRTVQGSYSGWSDAISGTSEANTTFAWKLASDSSGDDAVAISGETASTHTLATTDEGQYLLFCVTPRNNNGASGDEVCSTGTWIGPSARAFVPSLSGAVATGSYDFDISHSASGQSESGSQFQWLRASDEAGTDAVEIDGATSQTYTVTTSDEGKYLFFCVVPVDAVSMEGTQACSLAGTAVPVFGAPSVSNVTAALAGSTVTGSYTYSDPSGIGESGSTFQWYRASTNSFSAATAISGATASTYTASGDAQYLFFCVTPSNGYATGSTACSSSGAFYVGPTASSVSQSASSCSLTGSYTFSDANGGTESGSTFQWMRNSSNSSSGATAISGATSQSYTVVDADAGKYLFFCVTPKTASTTGVQTCASSGYRFSQPVASSVAIAQSSSTLTGSYSYSSCFSNQTPTANLTWYRNTSQSFTGASLVTYGATHIGTYNGGDQGAYLSFCVTPYDGGLSGTKTCSSWFQFVPVASNVQINVNGSTLNGSYSFTDYLGYSDHSTKQWYRSTSSTSLGNAITNATGNFWNLVSQDSSSYITYCVTPADGYTSGTQVCSSSLKVFPTSAPISMTIGSRQATGSYTYASTIGASEQGSTYWYERASDANGSNAATIDSQTKTHNLVLADGGQFLRFCVIPKDANGLTGPENCTSWTPVGPVVTLFADENYGGASVTIAWKKAAWGNAFNMADYGLDNQVSSLQFQGIPAGATLWIYLDANATGTTATYSLPTGGVELTPSMTSRYGASWDNTVSSFKVTWN